MFDVQTRGWSDAQTAFSDASTAYLAYADTLENAQNQLPGICSPTRTVHRTLIPVPGSVSRTRAAPTRTARALKGKEPPIRRVTRATTALATATAIVIGWFVDQPRRSG